MPSCNCLKSFVMSTKLFKCECGRQWGKGKHTCYFPQSQSCTNPFLKDGFTGCMMNVSGAPVVRKYKYCCLTCSRKKTAQSKAKAVAKKKAGGGVSGGGEGTKGSGDGGAAGGGGESSDEDPHTDDDSIPGNIHSCSRRRSGGDWERAGVPGTNLFSSLHFRLTCCPSPPPFSAIPAPAAPKKGGDGSDRHPQGESIYSER